ncbi:hypothetical protein PFICI_11018 [Pestalotiopsis fici W106-1]|uniref:Uncharacterized protein n=1 Tax=Pestalotiopsis fici (strain W106-1 / CGMCC3.15140) TaxID=1229662 RepID=W3WTK9_PESFW|nr:uncharacterized protein PFICI_11018 [Pestalotiopsis fici W106-1]ETS77144.1 hypothetical protein PFICI_11018 [Pestalotiopsis fici W106-1]
MSMLKPSQVGQFLAYIGVPRQFHNAPPSLSLLKTIHTYMISTCPYENLSIHYNQSHSISLDPQFLFNKIVTNNRGRGGYCMELAILYNHVLRGLGFQAYTVGARTRRRFQGVPQGDYPGWVHIVNIVTFPDQDVAPTEPKQYAVDVAFGGDGPTAPLPLISGTIHQNLGTQQVRLLRDWIPTQVHRTEESKLWIYQYRNSADAEWNSYYAFTETEFMAADWEVVNHWASCSPNSHQTWTALVVKFLRRPAHDGADQDAQEEIYGKRTLFNGVIKENLGGRSRLVVECKTEAERIEALEKYFGLRLTEEEVLGITGWATDLNSKGEL